MKKYSNKKRRKTGSGLSHVGIERTTINNDEHWRDLSAAAKILYLHIKGRYNGRNNGEIQLTYKKMKGVKGCSSSESYSRASAELEKKGWIKRSSWGGLFRYKTKYELTFKYDRYAEGS